MKLNAKERRMWVRLRGHHTRWAAEAHGLEWTNAEWLIRGMIRGGAPKAAFVPAMLLQFMELTMTVPMGLECHMNAVSIVQGVFGE